LKKNKLKYIIIIEVNKMDCIFCKIINGDIPSYKLYEDENVLCFLDVNPISKGHTLIVPKKHYKDIYDIPVNELTNIFSCVKKMSKIINDTYNPIGIKIVQNNGSIQEVKHYHVHIIPIYNKEENESIQKVYNEIKNNC
jgi:histidine triad (HIT) family protein